MSYLQKSTKALFFTLVISVALVSIISQDSFAFTINVPSDSATIQSAIDGAVNGDTVLIAPGTYTGVGNRNILLDHKYLTIIGASDPDSTIIDCENEDGFIIESDTINDQSTFKNLYITNAENGIELYQAGLIGINLNIQDCHLNGIILISTFNRDENPKYDERLFKLIDCNISFCYHGLGGSGSGYNVNSYFERCTFSNCFRGTIYRFNGEVADFEECIFLDNEIGIKIYEGSTFVTVDSCFFDGNGTAIEGSQGLQQTMAVLDNTTIKNGGWGLYLNSCSLTNSIFENLVSTFRGKSFDASNCIFRSNSETILSFFQTDDCCVPVTIDSCKFYNNGGGIKGEATSINFLNSEYYNNSEGIRAEHASDLIFHNSLYANNAEGIYIFHTGYGLDIQNSTIVNNHAKAIEILYSWGNRNKYFSGYTIVNNIIADNDSSGIDFFFDPNAIPQDTVFTIVCNDVYNNAGGNYVGIADQTGINNNLSVDPLFCDAANSDYYVSGSSEMLPENNSCGVLIGAFGLGCGASCADFNVSGSIDISDAVYLIEYIFTGGPAPDDLSGGDINCDGQTNIVDAVYLINFIFYDGPTPCEMCL